MNNIHVYIFKYVWCMWNTFCRQNIFNKIISIDAKCFAIVRVADKRERNISSSASWLASCVYNTLHYAQCSTKVYCFKIA